MILTVEKQIGQQKMFTRCCPPCDPGLKQVISQYLGWTKPLQGKIYTLSWTGTRNCQILKYLKITNIRCGKKKDAANNAVWTIFWIQKIKWIQVGGGLEMGGWSVGQALRGLGSRQRPGCLVVPRVELCVLDAVGDLRAPRNPDLGLALWSTCSFGFCQPPPLSRKYKYTCTRVAQTFPRLGVCTFGISISRPYFSRQFPFWGNSQTTNGHNLEREIANGTLARYRGWMNGLMGKLNWKTFSEDDNKS